MKYQFTPSGVCSRAMFFEVDENDCVHNVQFEGGCNGNLKGIGSLVEGMKREDVIKRLSGIMCGQKATSCPDQFAKALSEAK